MFTVKVLGGLSVESTAGPVPAGALQRRRLSLLALIGLGGERGLSRERIQSYLWPESDAARARHALDQLLYATRRELGYEAIASSATDLRFDPSIVRVDLWAFDDAIRAERWEAAVTLYGGPVLHGIHLGQSAELERWVEAERTLREQNHLRALDALAEAATRRGDAVTAVQWRRRQSAADPLSVPVALDLMRALEAANDRAGAVQHARLYRQLVTSTLEVDPDRSVTALANAIAARAAAESGGTNPETPTTLVAAQGRPLPSASATAPSGSRDARARRIWTGGISRASTLTIGLIAVTAVIFARSQSLGSTAQGDTSILRSSSADGNGPRVGGSRRVARDETEDRDARALYRRARALWEKRTRQPLEEAVVLFRLATERDPSYAAAYGGLAQSYAMLGYFGFADGDAMFPKARAAAVRALELDPESGDAYAALGQALAWQHDWTGAESAYRRALELSPEDATAHQWYALLLAYRGRAREAALHTGHASRLDPLSVQVNNMHGMMLYYAGDLDSALRQYERTVNAEPDSAWVRKNPWVLTNYSRIAAAAGRHPMAVALVERALEVVPSHPRPLFDLAYAYAVAGRPDSARIAFARADTAHQHYAVYRALLHGLLGERDEAFAWFERVTEWPLPALVTLNCESRLAALRADARFEQVRRRLNLPG